MTVLGVRLTAEESGFVDAIVETVPIATRHRVARVALLRGLAEIERDPGVLLLDPTEGTRPKAKKVSRRRSS